VPQYLTKEGEILVRDGLGDPGKAAALWRSGFMKAKGSRYVWPNLISSHYCSVEHATLTVTPQFDCGLLCVHLAF